MISYSMLEHKAMVLEVSPNLAIWYGELPKGFIDTIKQASGFDGLDLLDYLDSVVFASVGILNLSSWAEEQFRIQAEREKKFKAIQTYVFLTMAVIAVIPAITTAFTAASTAMTTTEVTTLSTISKIKLGASAFASSIADSFKAMLTAIHFDTLVRVHHVLEIVSPNYRELLRSVYGEISKVSEALGFGPHFLSLALQNMRTLVLDASSLFGRGYDMGEIQWLNSFQGYLSKFSAATYRYANDPEALFFDMARWVEKPMLDNKGSFIEGLIITVERTTEAVEGFVDDLTTVRDDFDRLVLQLPENIREHVEPLVRPYLEKFDNFKEANYDPFEKEINRLLDAVEVEQKAHRERMDDIIERLKKPGDLLEDIDRLSLAERLLQEDKISAIANRSLTRGSETGTPFRDQAIKGLLGIREAFTEQRERPSWYVEEMEMPSRPAGAPVKERKTWFVGDY